MDALIKFIKDEYGMDEIPGISINNGEVWLNLDWSAKYPGGPYFEAGNENVQREVIFIRDVYNEINKTSPKVIPLIDAMDNTTGWVTLGDNKGSSISIKSVPGKKGYALEISYDLNENGWVGISKEIDPKVLSEIIGIEFSHNGIGRWNGL